MISLLMIFITLIQLEFKIEVYIVTVYAVQATMFLFSLAIVSIHNSSILFLLR